VTLVADFVVFFGIYITLTPLVRAVTKGDLDLVELTLTEPALLGRVASLFLRYERWLVGFGAEGKQPSG
jgi:2-keto-3-deoxy-6-phosphogluconate aldolase